MDMRAHQQLSSEGVFLKSTLTPSQVLPAAPSPLTARKGARQDGAARHAITNAFTFHTAAKGFSHACTYKKLKN